MPASSSHCLHCGKPIKSGRSDKKFCDTGCKDAYFNVIKIAEHKEIRKIDTILKKNRRILKRFFDPAKSDKQFTREQLLKAGFEFGFHTHTVVTRSKSNEIIFCYNYGYREIAAGKFQLFPSFGTVRVKNGDEIKVR